MTSQNWQNTVPQPRDDCKVFVLAQSNKQALGGQDMIFPTEPPMAEASQEQGDPRIPTGRGGSGAQSRGGFTSGSSDRDHLTAAAC